MDISKEQGLNWMARAGHAARGVVYVLAGLIILLSGRGISAGSAVAALNALPLAPLLLALMGAGLFGYGLFRLHEAAVDGEGHGDGWRGRALRLARAIGGLTYWALAAVAFRTLLIGFPDEGAGGESAARGAALEVAHQPGGDLLLLLAGGIILAIAATQARRSWSGDFMTECGQDVPSLVRFLGRMGFAARALVIALVGWFVVRAALTGGRVRGMAGSIDALRGQEALLVAVAAGLILFGLFSLAVAKYRRN